MIELTDDDLWRGPEELLYVECHEDEAETILEIRVTVPNAMDNHPFRIPLCRRKLPKLDYPMRYVRFAADGMSPEGFGIGFSGGYRIDADTDKTLQVSFSLDWTATDHTRGSFDESLPITIGESSVKELDGDVRIRWTFRDPVSVNDQTKNGDGGHVDGVLQEE